MNRTLLAFFLLSAAARAGLSQDTLSIEGAVQRGLERNFDIQFQELDESIALNNQRLGERARYPTVSFSLNQNNTIIQRKPANPFAVPGKNISDNIGGQLDLQFVLFNGFAIRLERQRLHELARLSNGNVLFVIENTIQSIILSYYAVLLERERLNVLHRVMDFSRQQYGYVKLRKELGSAITFDVLNEQNNYLTDSANYLLQEMALKSSIRNLNILMNENLGETYTLTDSLFVESESYIYADLFSAMTRSNTNLRNQYINQQLARTTTELARSGLYPSITFNLGGSGNLDQLNANFRSPTGDQVQTEVGYAYVNNVPTYPVYNTVNETSFTRQTQKGHSYGAYGNFALRWTLFSAGQIKTAIENARIQEQMVHLDSEQLKLLLGNELMLVYDQYDLRQQLVTIALTRLEAAELNLSLANERYKNGSISALDLRIIQQNFRNAALENYAAIYAVLESKVNLIRLVGGLVSEYSNSEN